MAKGTVQWVLLLVVLLLGLVAGTVLGEILARLLPEGPVRDFFGASREVGVRGPVELDLGALDLVFGAVLRVNLLGVLGLIAAGIAYYRLS